MKYMCLIYSAEGTGPSTDDEQRRNMEAYFAFTDEVAQAGALVSGEPLQPIDTATTVRVRDGRPIVTDGPFAETREQLGGFYLLECDNLDEALAYAAKIPTAAFGSIEVRPLMELPDRDG